MFDGLYCVPHFKHVGSAGIPYLDPTGPDEAECAFITEHYAAPVLLSPANILLGKGQPFGLHFFCEKRFLGSHSGQNLELVDNEPVDMFHANGGHLRHLFFDVAGGGFFFTNLSRIFRSLLVMVTGRPAPFFLSGMAQGGSSLALVRSR
jgi:hypothetical protein